MSLFHNSTYVNAMHIITKMLFNLNLSEDMSKTKCFHWIDSRFGRARAEIPKCRFFSSEMSSTTIKTNPSGEKERELSQITDKPKNFKDIISIKLNNSF